MLDTLMSSYSTWKTWEWSDRGLGFPRRTLAKSLPPRDSQEETGSLSHLPCLVLERYLRCYVQGESTPRASSCTLASKAGRKNCAQTFFVLWGQAALRLFMLSLAPSPMERGFPGQLPRRDAKTSCNIYVYFLRRLGLISFLASRHW